jgi:CheY-like chemotaxis protein
MSPEEGLHFLQENSYDLMIADIGKDIDKGLQDLQKLKEQSQKALPVIVYLDKDISQADELKLKKVSDVIIMNSSRAEERLIDELELFLHKIQHTQTSIVSGKAVVQQEDNTLMNKKVLVVDDDMRNLFALTALLEEQGMQVTTASDGREALDKLQTERNADIVLMDIMMPEMDGYEAIAQIRNNLRLTHLPVIALTAKAMTGDKEKAIAAGASDYITKPVDTGKLFSLLRVWLSR